MFEDEAVCYRGNESETSSTLSPSSVESDASVASSGSSVSVSSLPRHRLDSVSDTPMNLKLMYTNIDTFLNKREELLTRLSADDPDILGIVELLPKKRVEFNSCEYKLPNYTLFMGPNPTRGVAIYIRDKFKARAHYFLYNDFEEVIWCVVHLDRGEKLLVGVIYRSPNSSGNNNNSLLKLFEDVSVSSLPRHRLDSVSDTPMNLKLMYTNIDTFLNKREELLTRLSADDPDILGIVELLPKKRVEFNSCEYKLPNYTLFMGPNPTRGVAIYIRDKFKARAHYFLYNDFEEVIWCVVHLDRGEKLLVGVIYRSPNSSGNNNNSLLKLFEDVADSSYGHILIMGDFNYKDIDSVSNTSRLGANSDTSRFVESVLTLGWYQHIHQNTRFRQGDTPSLLDLLVTNDEGMIQKLMYDSPIGKSDHVAVKFLCNCFGELKNRKANFRYYNGDYLGLTNYLDNQDWSIISDDQGSLREKWEFFLQSIHKAINQFIPRRVSSGKSRPKWMKAGLLDQVKEKHSAWNRYKKNRSDDNWKVFVRARNKTTRCVRDAKRYF